MNFREETLEELKDNNKKQEDVLWCEMNGICFTFQNFLEQANFEYDDGYGGNEIPLDTIIVGKNFWLERHEYDGSEWWEYKELPIATEIKKIEIKKDGWNYGGCYGEVCAIVKGE